MNLLECYFHCIHFGCKFSYCVYWAVCTFWMNFYRYCNNAGLCSTLLFFFSYTLPQLYTIAHLLNALCWLVLVFILCRPSAVLCYLLSCGIKPATLRAGLTKGPQPSKQAATYSHLISLTVTLGEVQRELLSTPLATINLGGFDTQPCGSLILHCYFPIFPGHADIQISLHTVFLTCAIFLQISVPLLLCLNYKKIKPVEGMSKKYF